MRNFQGRGFQLRTASLEIRVAYTAFLVLMVPGVASLLVLSFGRVGLAPDAIAAYYRGGDGEMSFPRTFWQLLEVSHFHLFSVPVVVLILSHLLYAAVVSSRLRMVLTVVTFAGALLEIAGPWAVRYVAGGFAYALLAGWFLLGGGMATIILLTLVAMWRPEPPDRDADEEGRP
jgi:hypothetical protein